MKQRKVRIPEVIFKAIETHLSELGVDSVEEYISAVLRERLQADGFLPSYGTDEEKDLERRLRELGYLD